MSSQKTKNHSEQADQAETRKKPTDKPGRLASRGSDKMDYTVIRVRVEPRLREAIDEIWSHENYRDYTQQSLIAHLVRKGLRYTQRELDMFDDHGILRDPNPTPPTTDQANTAHG